MIVLADLVQQTGYLSLPFHRVYFKDGSVHQENLPDNRFKLPVALRANYFLGDRFIIRAGYRFYSDDWGLMAHTLNIEVPIKITPFISISPYYRYYNQSGNKYFAPYQQHTAAEEFVTSNYDLADFSSSFFGAGIRLAPAKGIFGIKRFKMVELRYGHYNKSIPMNANIISLNLQYR